MDKFIKTKDCATRDKLLKEGFTMISDQSGIYTFINDVKKMQFDKTEHIVFSNMLEF